MGGKYRRINTSVETSVAASSTNQALRLPTKSVVRRTTFAKSYKKATVLRKLLYLAQLEFTLF